MNANASHLERDAGGIRVEDEPGDIKMLKPHGILVSTSCDTIAETTEGLSDKAYKELWNVLSSPTAKPYEEIHHEDACPQDAIGFNTPAAFWDLFSDEVKEELIRIADEAEKEFKKWREEFDRKYPPRI